MFKGPNKKNKDFKHNFSFLDRWEGIVAFIVVLVALVIIVLPL